MHCSSGGGACTHVLDRHVLLQRRHALHRAERSARLRCAALNDARLVEVDVRLDQAGTGEAAARVVNLRIRRDRMLDRHDAAVRDADVMRPVAVGQARIADDEIH